MNAQNKNEKIVDKNSEKKKGTEPSGGILSCFEWMESIITALIIVTLVFTFMFRIVTVSGSSMEPNLWDKERLVVSGFMYHPKQGDVVVISHTDGLKKPIIKRVIALPGQKVNIDFNKGIVYVNGKALDESSYIQNGITHLPTPHNPLIQFPQTVPAGHVFVLGDNRTISEDSRYVTVDMVDERYVLGKADVIIYPFKNIGKVKS